MEKALLRVRVNPRSSRNQITGWQGDVLCIKLTAPPVEGAANKAAVEFLADQLGVKKSQVTLVSGAACRDKVFEVEGLSEAELRRRLGNARRCMPAVSRTSSGSRAAETTATTTQSRPAPTRGSMPLPPKSIKG